MAKKSRRARARTRTRTGESLTQRKNIVPVQAPPQPQGTRLSASSQPAAPANVIKANQYAYVVSDLIRVGIIAGALILVLIILTFILR
jgi:hypothetical protein